MPLDTVVMCLTLIVLRCPTLWSYVLHMSTSSKSKHVSLRLPNDILAQVTEHSVRQRRTLSQMVVLLIESGISGHASAPNLAPTHAAADIAALLPRDIADEARERAKRGSCTPLAEVVGALREIWCLVPPEDEWRS